MRTIFKYPLDVADEQVVALPHGAQILCAQMQHSMPCIWAEVDRQAPVSQRIFYMYGTGHRVPTDRVQTYVGTVQLSGGALVFHVYVN